jgi:hypothetical protein
MRTMHDTRRCRPTLESLEGRVLLATYPIAWPGHVFAPYIDETTDSATDMNLVGLSQASGVKFFTLGFITSDRRSNPVWGDAANTLTSRDFGTTLVNSINALRALGGDVAISFGGAGSKELAQTIANVAALQAAYQKVVSTYGVTHIDFDIEGTAITDKASIDRRSLALAGLQKANPGLSISFTLPVLPTGLDSNGLYVLKSALARGVGFSRVNIMAMDYGNYYAPNPAGKMGDYAIQAAQATAAQLAKLQGKATPDQATWSMIGVTPMIGVNDVRSEVFDVREAQELANFAKSQGLGLLSMWSVDRDHRAISGGPSDYAFSAIFEGYQTSWR